MENIFIKLLNMSISASWIIMVVFLLRIILKKIPRNVFCILWALAAVRLICPVSMESIWSLIPSAEVMSPGISPFYQAVNTPITDNKDINLKTILSDSQQPHNKNSTTKQTIFPTFAEAQGPKDTTNTSIIQYGVLAATIIWISGMVLFILYTAAKILKTYRRISEGIVLQGNILLCDHVYTPFIWGILHPKIILPSSIKGQHLEYVLAHEKAHLSRHDHWWKPLGFALLIIYWFNPLVWAAYKFFCRDIELACDERVIKNYDIANKKMYSLALLDCSTWQAGIFIHPLAFGEIGVKERIKAIMKYKKPTFSIIFIAAVVCITLSVCFLTNPKETHIVNANTPLVENVLLNQHSSQTEGALPQNHNKELAANEPQTEKNSFSDIIKNGETRGYITELGEDTITVDLQNWVTEEDEDWKAEYDRDVGFKVVDVEGEDVTFQLSKNCAYYILEHHQGPAVELDYKKFKKYYREMEYPILWFITFDNNQRITGIQEQYRP